MRQTDRILTPLLLGLVLSTIVQTSSLAQEALSAAAETELSHTTSSGCVVPKEIGSYTVPNIPCETFWKNIYPTNHPCSTTVDRPKVCTALDAYRAIDWEAPLDMINTGHRGIWAMDVPANATQNTSFDYRNVVFNTRTPENTIKGAIEAQDANLSGVEYDAMIMSNAFDAINGIGEPNSAYFTHYSDFYYYTDFVGAYDTTLSGPLSIGLVNNTNPTELAKSHPNLVIKDKFGRPQIDPDNVKLNSAAEFLSEYLKNTQDLILFIDAKHSRSFPKHYLDEKGDLTSKPIANFGFAVDNSTEKTAIFTSILKSIDTLHYERDQRRAQAMLVLKSGPGYSALELEKAIQAANVDKNYVLVVPNMTGWCTGPDGACTDNDRKVELDRLDEFYSVFGYKGILYYEITYLSAKHWSANSFTRDGQAYADLTDYVKRKYNLRSAFWFPTATGFAGNHVTWFQTDIFSPGLPDWEHQGTLPGNQLGKMFYEPTYLIGNAQWMTHAVSVNERPEIYLQIRNELIKALQ